MTTLNIFQAAFKLRNDFAHTGITLDYMGENNTYFIFHDALHTYTNCAPQEEFEAIVLSVEMILGGVDCSALNVGPDVLANAIASIPTEVIEELISFYTSWFN